MNSDQPSEGAPITHYDMSGKASIVGKNIAVSHHGIVGDMASRHKEILISYHALHITTGGTRLKGDILTDHVPVANYELTLLTLELKILRRSPNRGELIDAVFIAKSGTPLNHDVRRNVIAFSKHRTRAND